MSKKLITQELETLKKDIGVLLQRGLPVASQLLLMHEKQMELGNVIHAEIIESYDR